MNQRQVTFVEAVKMALQQNYCNFEGRSSRSEYWWFVLFNFILSAVISLVFSFSQTVELIMSGVVSLALLLPDSDWQCADFTIQAVAAGGCSSH